MTLPPPIRGGSRRVAPPAGLTTARGRQSVPSARVTSRANPTVRNAPKLFTFALAFYVCVTVGRLHEVVPFLAHFYLGKLSALLLVVAFLVDAPNIRLASALKSKTAKCIGVVSLLALLSVPGSYWPGYSVGFLTNVWPLIVLLGCAILAGFSDRRIAYVSMACLTAVAGLAAAELMLGGGLVTTTSLSASSAAAVEARAFIGGSGSTTYDANYSAAFFVMMLPYALMFAGRRGLMRWVALPLVPVLAVAMIRTGSRGGIVALATLLVCTVIFSEKKQRKLQLLFFGLAIGAMLLSPHAELAERLRSLFNGDDYNFDSPSGRWAVWGRGIGFMIHRPFAGVGIGAFMSANGATAGSYVDAHNTYVQIAAELGVGGIATFIVMISTAFKSIWKRRLLLREIEPQTIEASLDSALATAALCSLIAELTAAAFLSMAYEAMTMFALTVPIGLAMAQHSSMPALARAVTGRRRGAAVTTQRRTASPPRISRSGA